MRFAFLVLFLSCLVARADFVLSDGTIIVTGRNSIHTQSYQSQFGRPPEFARAISVIPPSPKEVKLDESNLVWNKWDAGNFAVLSLDKAEGQRLDSEIEALTDSIFNEFGIGSDLTTPCKIVCVPDASSLKRLFGLESSHWEVKRDSTGKVVSAAIWLNSEERDMLPYLLFSVCSEDLMPNAKWFFLRGTSLLCKPGVSTRNLLSDVKSINSEKIFSVTKEKWAQMKPEERLDFDRSAAIICLLIRREFGRLGFSRFAPEQDVSAIGFKTVSDFDDVVKRYSENLSSDIRKGITPDKYLDFTGR